MNRILKRRLPREIKSHFWRWLALFLMTAMGMAVVVSVVGSAENIIRGSSVCAEENQVEDGEFTTIRPLTKEQEEHLRQQGVILEQKFSTDIEQEDGSVLRFMSNREEINLIAVDEGRTAEKKGEVLLEKRYCEEHEYMVGDRIRVLGMEFEIVGIGTTPDYDLPVRNFSDMSAESFSFGTAFVTAGQYRDLTRKVLGKIAEEVSGKTPDEILGKPFEESSGEPPREVRGKVSGNGMQSAESYTYAYILLNDVTHDAVKNEVRDVTIAYTTAEDNPRILAAAGDMVLNRTVGLLAGGVVLALFAYIISVFMIHQINCEAGVIGTLYALGVKKRDLLLHYITLPAAVSLLGGASGLILGSSGFGMAPLMQEVYGYFSVPVFDRIYPAYLILYGVILPPAISVLVNFLVINRRLSQTALSLIRNEKRASGLRNITLKGGSFTRNFCIRQMLRELRTSVSVTVGMFVSMMIFMLGLNCFVLCRNVGIDSKNSVKFEYMYTGRFLEENVPEGGEACLLQSLSITKFGYTLDVSLMGITENSRFFDTRPVNNKNSLVIGSSLATKYGLARGDILVLYDKAGSQEYKFTVEGICDYSVGLTAFMEIGCMRELLGKSEADYNVLLADRALETDENCLYYSTTTRSDIERSSAVFVEMMAPMVRMLLAVSVIVFFAVMYLLTGVMIDRAGFGISLVKIFGFREKEIRILYLRGITITVAAGAALCIPLSKAATDAIYPWAVANVACGMNLHFRWYYYPLIFAGVMGIYFLSGLAVSRKINRITPAEVLKDRE